jgi:adenosylcobinamide kinase / adenosylcobinamide-phosphate guanylyltransferase
MECWMITLVFGGTRSGKSALALRKAGSFPGRKAYIATARALDPEMEERIRAHKAQRGEEWDTFEEPVHLREALSRAAGNYGAIIVDCLTLWLSNILDTDATPENEITALTDMLARADERSDIYLVSNEVGMGIVPDNALARRFRDLSGTMNQRIADVAREVYFVAAGLPLRLK